MLREDEWPRLFPDYAFVDLQEGMRVEENLPVRAGALGSREHLRS